MEVRGPRSLTHLHQLRVSHGVLERWAGFGGGQRWKGLRVLRGARGPLHIISQLGPLLPCCRVIPDYLLTLRWLCVYLHGCFPGNSEDRADGKVIPKCNCFSLNVSHSVFYSDMPTCIRDASLPESLQGAPVPIPPNSIRFG